MLDYKLLEALSTVVREGGFEKAARVLFITQSAVSQRIKTLEEQTGQVLLVRANPPKATEAGLRLMKHCLQVKRLEGDLFGGARTGGKDTLSTVPIGVNADSIATWFLEAVHPFLENERVLLDIRVDDQEQTHNLLRNGEVMGCISTHAGIIQGCRNLFLGEMAYRLFATPAFVHRYFPHGVTADTARAAPILIFNRKDELHRKLYFQRLGTDPGRLNTHFLPSSEKFADFIAYGHACGMLPDRQSAPLVASGVLVEVASGEGVRVPLFWHCWNIRSRLLERLTEYLIAGSRSLLHPGG